MMHCSGNKIVVIVGKRAERPLPGWAVEMRWRAKAPSKARRQQPLAFAIYVPDGGGRTTASASFVCCLRSPSFHSITLFPSVSRSHAPFFPYSLMPERTQASLRDAVSEKEFIKCSSISKKMEKWYHYPTVCDRNREINKINFKGISGVSIGCLFSTYWDSRKAVLNGPGTDVQQWEWPCDLTALFQQVWQGKSKYISQ